MKKLPIDMPVKRGDIRIALSRTSRIVAMIQVIGGDYNDTILYKDKFTFSAWTWKTFR